MPIKFKWGKCCVQTSSIKGGNNGFYVTVPTSLFCHQKHENGRIIYNGGSLHKFSVLHVYFPPKGYKRGEL